MLKTIGIVLCIVLGVVLVLGFAWALLHSSSKREDAYHVSEEERQDILDSKDKC